MPSYSDRSDVSSRTSIATKDTNTSKDQLALGPASSDESWSTQRWPMLVSVLCVLLGCTANGWALGGAGGTLTQDAFLQNFHWEINCLDTKELEAVDPLAATCAGRFPTATLWAGDGACIGCCCDKNTEVDRQMYSGLVGSLGLWGSAVGSLLIGPFADTIGRKKAVMLASLIMIVSESCSGFSPSGTAMALFFTGRFFTGISIGALVTAAPLYLSELAPANLRGSLGSVSQFGLTLGMALVALWNVHSPTVDNGWRFSYAGGLMFAIPNFIGLLIFGVESPRYLIMKGKPDQAYANLLKLRKNFESADAEHASLMSQLEGVSNPWKPKNAATLFKKENRWKILSMFFLHFIQQMSGVNAIGFFSPTIYTQFYDPVTAAWGYVGQVFGKLIALILGILFIDKWGRKLQLQLGGWTMTLTLFTIGLLAYPYNYYGAPQADYPDGSPPYLSNQSVGVCIIVMCWVYMIGFSYAWGGIPFVITAEYLPQNVRSIGMSLCGVISWSTGGVLAQIFPYMRAPEGLDLWGSFIFFSCCTIIGNIFALLFLMETKGIAMEDMQNRLRDFRDSNRFVKMFCL